jgi:hypothetical protein
LGLGTKNKRNHLQLRACVFILLLSLLFLKLNINFILIAKRRPFIIWGWMAGKFFFLTFFVTGACRWQVEGKVWKMQSGLGTLF